MALHKKVKLGGTYFKGYQLTVNATPGDYVLHISEPISHMVSGMTITPDAYGIGDYMTIAHYTDVGAGATLIDTLADTVYNPGAVAAYNLTFPAIEPFEHAEDLRVTYTNVAGVAVNVSILVEFVR